MPKHQERTVHPQQPEEITPVANTADQPANPEAGQDLNRITLPEPVTIKGVAEAYIDHLTLGGQTKMSTITVYQNALQLAVNHFGADRRIDSILVPHVGRYYNSPEVNTLPNGKPKAAPTVKQIKRVFRQCLEFAQTYGWISGKLPIPNAEMKHARHKKSQPEPVSPEPAEAPETVAAAERQAASDTTDVPQN